MPGTAARPGATKPRPAREILRDNVRDVALDYLALGLDPAKAAFYRQSDLPEVTELAWHHDECVMARQGSVMVAAFHPELTDQPTAHAYFAEMVRKSAGSGSSR